MTYKTEKIILFASLIALIAVPVIAIQSADASATDCPTVGLNQEKRCYATKEYIPSSNRPTSLNVDITYDDVNPQNGFLQNAVWAHLSNGIFIEAGMLDQSSNKEKILCGKNGFINNFQRISLSDGDKLNAYVLGLSNGNVWKIGVKHTSTNSEQSCTVKTPALTHINKFVMGSEASKPNNPNYNHDWNDLEINYSNVVSSDFSSTRIVEEGTGYSVEECGSGNEQYRHIKTGKGNVPSC